METTQTHIIECNRATSSIDTNTTAPAKWSSQCSISLKAGDKIAVEAAVINSTGASSNASVLEFTGENVIIDGEEQEYTDNLVVFELGFYMQNDSTKCLNLPVRLPYALGANESYKGGAYGTAPYGSSDDPYWFGPNAANLQGTNTDVNTFRLRQRQNPSLNVNRSENTVTTRQRPAVYPPPASTWANSDESIGIGGDLANASMYPACGVGFDAKVNANKVGSTVDAGSEAQAYQWIGCLSLNKNTNGYDYLPGIAKVSSGSWMETQVDISTVPTTKFMRSVWRDYDTGYGDGNPWRNTQYMLIATPEDNQFFTTTTTAPLQNTSPYPQQVSGVILTNFFQFTSGGGGHSSATFIPAGGSAISFQDSGASANYSANENRSVTFHCGTNAHFQIRINNMEFEQGMTSMYDRMGITAATTEADLSLSSSILSLAVAPQLSDFLFESTNQNPETVFGTAYSAQHSGAGGWIIPGSNAAFTSNGGSLGTWYDVNAEFIRFYFQSDTSVQKPGWNMDIRSVLNASAPAATNTPYYNDWFYRPQYYPQSEQDPLPQGIDLSHRNFRIRPGMRVLIKGGSMTTAASYEPLGQFPSGVEPVAYPYGVGVVKAIHRFKDIYDKLSASQQFQIPDGKDANGNSLSFDQVPAFDELNRLVIEFEHNDLSDPDGVGIIIPQEVGISLCRKNYPETSSTPAIPAIYNTSTMVVGNSDFGGWSNSGVVWAGYTDNDGSNYNQKARMGIGLTNHSAAITWNETSIPCTSGQTYPADNSTTGLGVSQHGGSKYLDTRRMNVLGGSMLYEANRTWGPTLKNSSTGQSSVPQWSSYEVDDNAAIGAPVGVQGGAAANAGGIANMANPMVSTDQPYVKVGQYVGQGSSVCDTPQLTSGSYGNPTEPYYDVTSEGKGNPADLYNNLDRIRYAKPKATAQKFMIETNNWKSYNDQGVYIMVGPDYQGPQPVPNGTRMGPRLTPMTAFVVIRVDPEKSAFTTADDLCKQFTDAFHEANPWIGRDFNLEKLDKSVEKNLNPTLPVYTDRFIDPVAYTAYMNFATTTVSHTGQLQYQQIGRYLSPSYMSPSLKCLPANLQTGVNWSRQNNPLYYYTPQESFDYLKTGLDGTYSWNNTIYGNMGVKDLAKWEAGDILLRLTVDPLNTQNYPRRDLPRPVLLNMSFEYKTVATKVPAIHNQGSTASNPIEGYFSFTGTKLKRNDILITNVLWNDDNLDMIQEAMRISEKYDTDQPYTTSPLKQDTSPYYYFDFDIGMTDDQILMNTNTDKTGRRANGGVDDNGTGIPIFTTTSSDSQVKLVETMECHWHYIMAPQKAVNSGSYTTPNASPSALYQTPNYTPNTDIFMKNNGNQFGFTRISPAQSMAGSGWESGYQKATSCGKVKCWSRWNPKWTSTEFPRIPGNQFPFNSNPYYQVSFPFNTDFEGYTDFLYQNLIQGAIQRNIGVVPVKYVDDEGFERVVVGFPTYKDYEPFDNPSTWELGEIVWGDFGLFSPSFQDNPAAIPVNPDIVNQTEGKFKYNGAPTREMTGIGPIMNNMYWNGSDYVSYVKYAAGRMNGNPDSVPGSEEREDSAKIYMTKPERKFPFNRQNHTFVGATDITFSFNATTSRFSMAGLYEPYRVSAMDAYKVANSTYGVTNVFDATSTANAFGGRNAWEDTVIPPYSDVASAGGFDISSSSGKIAAAYNFKPNYPGGRSCAAYTLPCDELAEYDDAGAFSQIQYRYGYKSGFTGDYDDQAQNVQDAKCGCFVRKIYFAKKGWQPPQLEVGTLKNYYDPRNQYIEGTRFNRDTIVKSLTEASPTKWAGSILAKMGFLYEQYFPAFGGQQNRYSPLTYSTRDPDTMNLGRKPLIMNQITDNSVSAPLNISSGELLGNSGVPLPTPSSTVPDISVPTGSFTLEGPGTQLFDTGFANNNPALLTDLPQGELTAAQMPQLYSSSYYLIHSDIIQTDFQSNKISQNCIFYCMKNYGAGDYFYTSGSTYDITATKDREVTLITTEIRDPTTGRLANVGPSSVVLYKITRAVTYPTYPTVADIQKEGILAQEVAQEYGTILAKEEGQDIKNDVLASSKSGTELINE